MAEIEWHNLRSSNVARAAFDEDAGELLIQFKSGSTYAYPNQSESTLQDIVNASSPGGYVSRWLRNQPSRRIS